MASVLWFQGGACSGNTMSFLNADEPNVVDLIVDFGLEVIWHPSLGLELGNQAQKIFRDCASGARPMDVFVFEGTVIEGPNGTGRMDMFADRPMKDWVAEMAAQAGIVVAIGDCACWGGIPAMEPNPSGSTGLQFHKRNKGGFLGPDFRSKAGLPVINIPAARRTQTGSPKSWSRWPPDAPATSPSTICNGPRPSSRPSPRPAAPACSSTSTSSRRCPSARAPAPAACSTSSAAAAL